MKILITGASGQLGSELQTQLREQRSPLGAIPSAMRPAEVTALGRLALDISDPRAVNRAAAGYDVIINCAAFTNVDRCEEQPALAAQINGDGPFYLAEAAKKTGARLIHVSTDYVFSGEDHSPRSETDETAPKTVYGKTKLDGERRLLAVSEDAAVVRTAWLYGRAGRNFVKTILSAAREKGALTVVNDQFGSPTNAADLAHHILKLAASGERGIFHCAGHGVCSWYEFAAEIVGKSGIPAAVTPCTTAEYPRPAPRPAYSALCNRRLRETVGDEMRGWRDALAEYLDNLQFEDGRNRR